MIGQIVSLLLIAYLLFFFPILSGSLFIRKKQKDIGIAYLYGMTASVAIFMIEAYAVQYFDGSLSKLSHIYADSVLVVSLAALLQLYYGKGRLCLPFFYRYHYLSVGLLALAFTGLRQDSATDSVLENALTLFTFDRLAGLSPYSGEMIESAGVGAYIPAFYGVLSKLSGVHVTLIGKLLMPFVAVVLGLSAYRLLVECLVGMDTKTAWNVLWGVIFLWIFVCFRQLPGYRSLWEAPWTPKCLIWICFLPLLVALLLKKKWSRQSSILLGAVLIVICLGADSWMKVHVKEWVWLLFAAGLLIGILFGCRRSFSGQRVILPVLTAVLAVISIGFGGCIITDSTYGMPDNRYKMNQEVMQIRMLVEPIEQVKMLAPATVLAQIRDADVKVSLPLGTDAEVFESDRQQEIAEDLALHEYESIKLLQHGMAEGCNIVVTYREQEDEAKEQEELFAAYGFLAIGGTDSYVVYEYYGD